MTRQEIRDLYSQACHGAGAEPRWAARDVIEQHVETEGIRLRDLLEEHGLSLMAYFASRPISR